jgi:N-formylglutamate amidohydrolase
MKGLGENPGLTASKARLVEGDRGEAGDEHDAQLRQERADPARQLDAVDARHDDVGEEEIEIGVPGERQGRIAVANRLHLVAGPLKGSREEGAHVVIVFGEEYSRHRASDPQIYSGLAWSLRPGKLMPGKAAHAKSDSCQIGFVTGNRVAPKLVAMEMPPDHQELPPIEIIAPAVQTIPLILASPHSGACYPPALLAVSRLDPHALRRSEDSFVDEIFAAGPTLGAPLLRARFARAYLDANREPYELDPQMFEDPLPDFVNATSPRVQVGLGTIARIVATGEDIYAGKLCFADAEARIERLYRPYHRALGELTATTQARFGYYLLVDCHSMPSMSGPHERGGRPRVDFVLGDCHGAACHPVVIDTAQRLITAKGYSVARNAPYAGGFTTGHYGRPHDGGHALQIEINRSLYMDERTISRRPFLGQLAEDMRDLVAALGALDPGLLLPLREAAE